MDRGVPTEAILKDMRDPQRQPFYLVGTPKSKINQHEKKWLDLTWLVLRVGAAKKEAGRAFGFVKIQMPSADQAVTRETFSFEVDKVKLNAAEQRDGHYLLRSNLTGEDPAVLWTRYVQLTQIESVFRSVKSELSIRPIGQLATIQMVEVWIPLVDGRQLVMPRHTQPEPDVQALLNQIRITLPPQPPPRIKASQIPPKNAPAPPFFVVKT